MDKVQLRDYFDMHYCQTTRIQRPIRRWLQAPRKAIEFTYIWRYFDLVSLLSLTATYIGLRSYHSGDAFRMRFFDSAYIRTWQPSDVQNVWNIFGGREYRVSSHDTQIIDIGANTGVFALYAAICAPKASIVAFEPVKDTYQKLCEQVIRSSLQDRIKCVPKGVAGISGKRQILIGQSHDTASLYNLEVDGTDGDSTDKERIETLSLYSIYEEYVSGRLSLLKLDCEGAEWELFETTPCEVWCATDRICLEYHMIDSQTPDLITQKLESTNMQLIWSCSRPNRTGILWFAR